MYVPIRGFEPDADPTTPGILVDCDLIIPTLNGVAAFPGESDPGLVSASQTVLGITSLKLLNDTVSTYAGGPSKLFKLSTTTWTDVTRVSGDYSATAGTRWVFTQYQDRTLATPSTKTEPIQSFISGASDFVNTTSAPRATAITTVLDFVMAFNIDDTNEGNVYGDDPDRWWCCAAGNPGSWSADIATQATTGLLTDSPGPIVGGKRLGSNVVAYKETSMYLGQYVGTPLVWAWRLIPGEGLGAPSHSAVVDIDTAHLFPGTDNFYVYDGTRPQAIGTNRVADFFRMNLNYTQRKLMIGVHDRQNWRVYWWYPSGASTSLDSYLCYNYRSDRWGYGQKTIQYAYEFLAPDISYDDLGTYYSTYDDLPTGSYEEAFAGQSKYQLAIVNTSKKIQLLSGGGTNTVNYTTGLYGIDGRTSLVSRVRPRYATAADETGTRPRQRHLVTDQAGLGSTQVPGNTQPISAGAFDSVYAGRWHQFKHTWYQDFELTGIDIEITEDALE